MKMLMIITNASVIR